MATVSAESEEFGKKIAHAIDKVGKDGVVTVEESQSFGVESEFVEGMQFDKGLCFSLHDYQRRPDGSGLRRTVHSFWRTKKISAISEILPLLEKNRRDGEKEIGDYRR